uniref:CBM6 domain-containing protein n=1 Tax=Streptomyces sp. NBC_01401 TaxID=2903854 RepID=A0AAU3GZ37_9ACTN
MSPAPGKRARVNARLAYPVILSLLGAVLYGTTAAAVTPEAGPSGPAGEASVSAGPKGPAPTTVTYQAEDAFVSGGPAKATTANGSEGGAYLSGFTGTGARAVFAVDAPRAATYPLTVRYRTPDATASSVTLLANGTTVRKVTLPGTGGAWKSAATDVPLRAALNHVTLRTAAGASGTLQLDNIGVTGSTPSSARGATLPYTTYEAESGSTNATTIGPDRTYLTVPSEASDREAVVLDSTGEYVEFTLTEPANALTLRYSVPDNDAGTGIDTSLSVYADGTELRDLPLSSEYSWVYGEYPYTNDPSQGSGHHFFDETRTLLDEELPAGTVLKFQKDAGDTAASYTLDLVETETAPDALTMPSTGFVDATTLGVTPDDSTDDTDSLNSALSTATSQGKGLWLPEGEYGISGHVDLAGADLRGAGQWYTVLRGSDGKGGLFGRGGTSNVQDLMIAGDVSYRDDANFDAAVEGDFGDGSTLTNLWIQHTKVGLWTDAPTTGLYASGLRIRDTFADGVNLHKGTEATEVSQSSIRNTGDDGLAMFSESEAVTDSVFRLNTVQLPMLANTVGIYGGHGNRVEDNLLADTVTGSSGIAISSRFDPVPFSGTTSVQGNTLTRTGGYEPNWGTELGALWIYADSSDITEPVLVKDNEILDSTYSGLLVSWQKNVQELTVDGLKIDKAGSYGIEIDSAGAGSFSGVTVTDAASGGLSSAGGFTITRGDGNSGW